MCLDKVWIRQHWNGAVGIYGTVKPPRLDGRKFYKAVERRSSCLPGYNTTVIGRRLYPRAWNKAVLNLVCSGEPPFRDYMTGFHCWTSIAAARRRSGSSALIVQVEAKGLLAYGLRCGEKVIVAEKIRVIREVK